MKKTIYISLFTTMSIYLFAQTNTMQESMKRGKVVYDKVCLSCHMVDGGGVPNMNPPLTVADYLKDKKKMISIVLKGMTDRIPIDDEYYSNNMAPHADLSNQQIADVLTYIRNSFGNKAGAVTVVEVAAVRTPLPAKKVFPKKN